MRRLFPKGAPTSLVTRLGVLGFFVLFFGWVLWGIEPHLHHHARGQVFFLRQDFLEEHLSRPGGLVEYCAAFVIQGCANSWLGALITTALAGLICWVTRLFLRRFAGTQVQVLHLVPAGFLGALQSRYYVPLVEIHLGLLLTIALVVVYLRALPQKAWRRIPIFLLIAAFLYYAAAGFVLLFALLCGIADLLGKSRPSVGLREPGWWISGAFLLLIGLATPFVAAAAIFESSWAEAYSRLWLYKPRLFAGALYVFFPVAALAANLRPRQPVAALRRGRHPTVTSRSARLLSWTRAHWGPGASFVLLLLVGGGLALALYDGQQQALLQIDYHARHNQWAAVLQHGQKLVAMKVTAGAIAAGMEINRALFHSGRLPYDQFSTLQKQGIDLLPAITEIFNWGMCLSDTLWELGQVNYAEHWTHEVLEVKGDQPAILQRLALINIIKGRPQAARTFLNLLAQHPLHRRWAKERLRQLDTDPAGLSDPELAGVRPVMVRTDFPGSYIGTENLLLQLLHTNQRNRMAFEYLMAHYLLTRQLEKMIRNLGRLDDFDYLGIPRHYEEAVLMYQRLNAGRSVDLRERHISAQTVARFQDFDALYVRYMDDRVMVRQVLARSFGDTYWYYYLFGETPASSIAPASSAYP